MQYKAATVKSPVMDRQLHRHTFIKWQQADSAICRAISAGSEDTVVAYEASCDKRNSSRKSVSLRKNLSCHCKVCDTDEFCNSRLCCACKSAMDGMPRPVTVILRSC